MAPPWPPDTELQDTGELTVIVRKLRLPTSQIRQVRRMVALQLDRLSPLPGREVTFDVQPASDTVSQQWIVAIVRRSDLAACASGQRRIEIRRSFEGRDRVFRFRNPLGMSALEARLLPHAPMAFLMALSIAALALAGADRVQTWRDTRTVEIVRDAQVENRMRRIGNQQAQAQTAWMSTQRADAATRLLCILARLESAGEALTLAQLSADEERVNIQAAEPVSETLTQQLGATQSPGSTDQIIWEGAACR
jgi:hypothetical protein